jgi:tRNA modification GTPase
LAHPGEFTRQAFLNGKMDLVQAEAVAALIRSKSIESSRSQQKIIDGSLSIRLNIIQSNLSDLLSRLEHLLDISEEDVLSSDVNALLVDLDKISLIVNQLQKSFFLGRLLNGGATVVIVGATNVGKSTLLNRLSESDRAIVSNVPGTTRDTIDVELILDGVPVRFVDTAGLRDAKNSIEKEGVKRTYKAIEGADLVLSLTDRRTKKHFTGSDLPTINVLNKADLRNEMKTDGHIIHISAKSGAGINALKGRLINDLGINRLSTEEDYLSTSRQHLSIKKCSIALSRARSFFESDVLDVELLSFEVRSALDAIDALLGKTSPDKILNKIFDEMCVGK